MSSVEREEKVIPGSGNEVGIYTITGLMPFTTYYIGVAAYSDSGIGPFANITVETLLYGKSPLCLSTQMDLYNLCLYKNAKGTVENLCLGGNLAPQFAQECNSL